MAVLIQFPTRLPLPSRVAAPSRPESSGLWLLTAVLFLLLIVGRVTNFTAVNQAVKKQPASSMVLAPQKLQLPGTRGALLALPVPASPRAAVLTTAAQ